MKKSIISTAILLFISACCFLLTDCSSSGANNQSEAKEEIKPLNITVFIDLSDRLINGKVQPQMEIDTAIINHIVAIFIKDCLKSKIIGSKNSFQVLFYPTPSLSTINTLTADLKLDLSKTPIQEKKSKLIKFQQLVPTNLEIIYNNVIANKSWIGCDIWNFFSSKRIDQYCIKEGYQNYIVILTDGYLFHANNKIQDGNAYSYILPQTLSNPKSSLIVKRTGLNNLKILFLEINPYQPQQCDKIMSVIGEWLEGMGVPKDSYLINETDTEKNTEHIIDSFFN